jgi:hypothetical protein
MTSNQLTRLFIARCDFFKALQDPEYTEERVCERLATLAYELNLTRRFPRSTGQTDPNPLNAMQQAV